MAVQPDETQWRRMFYEPDPTHFDRQGCVDLLRQKLQAKVAKLFRQQSFKPIKASERKEDLLSKNSLFNILIFSRTR